MPAAGHVDNCKNYLHLEIMCVSLVYACTCERIKFILMENFSITWNCNWQAWKIEKLRCSFYFCATLKNAIKTFTFPPLARHTWMQTVQDVIKIFSHPEILSQVFLSFITGISWLSASAEDSSALSSELKDDRHFELLRNDKKISSINIPRQQKEERAE